MALFGGVIAAIGFAVFMTIFLALEERDKQKRRREGLPPKRYHDITDREVVDVIVHKFDD